jgi:4-oxalocrotonate tautomerase
LPRTTKASSVSIPGAIQFLNWLPGQRTWDVYASVGIDPEAANQAAKGTVMPLVDIHLIEGVFDKNQKQEMISKVTDAMVGIEGEAMRGVTWVRVHEVASGEWAIGGRALTAADVKALQEQRR